MKPHKYMSQPNKGSNKWYIIRKYPSDISHNFKGAQKWVSLKTGDLATANKRYPAVMAQIEAEFEQYRNSQASSLDTVDIEWIAKSWFEGQVQILNDQDVGFDSMAEKDDRINDIGIERTMWLEEGVTANAIELQGIADKVLIAAGLPRKPLNEIEQDLKRKKPYRAHVDKSEEKYHRFVQLIRRGLIELCERELLLLGVNVERTHLINLYHSSTALKKSSIAPTATSLSISDLTKKYMLRFDENLDSSSFAAKRAALTFLEDYVGGNTPIHMLQRSQVNDLRDKLKVYPSNAKKSNATKDMSFNELIDYAAKNNMKFLSVTTIKSRLRTIMAFTKWANAEGYVNKDVCRNLDLLSLKDSVAKKDKRAPFSYEQLSSLFSSEFYLNPKKPSEAMYWAPLLALFHGCRMEEILQLKTSDFLKDSKTGIEYFRIHGENGNKLKTSSAVRDVPLHSELIALGFHKYLSMAKKNGGDRLFAELNRGSDGSFRKPFSPKFRRLTEKVGIYTPKTNFHSFRHNFSDAAKNGGVPLPVLNQLIGWTQNGMHGVYGEGYDLATLREAMDKIEYPDLDLSHLH